MSYFETLPSFATNIVKYSCTSYFVQNWLFSEPKVKYRMCKYIPVTICTLLNRKKKHKIKALRDEEGKLSRLKVPERHFGVFHILWLDLIKKGGTGDFGFFSYHAFYCLILSHSRNSGTIANIQCLMSVEAICLACWNMSAGFLGN